VSSARRVGASFAAQVRLDRGHAPVGPRGVVGRPARGREGNLAAKLGLPPEHHLDDGVDQPQSDIAERGQQVCAPRTPLAQSTASCGPYFSVRRFRPLCAPHEVVQVALQGRLDQLTA